MEFTKERLLKIQSWGETYGPGSNVVLPAEEAEGLARIALAAQEAGPVYQWRERYEEGSLWEDCTKEQHDGFAKNPECEARVLYTAPPAPVLQEDIPDSVYEILCQACGGKAWMYEAALWDACRDEILKNSASTKPSTDAGCVTNNPSNCASVKSSTDAGCVTNTRSNCASVKDHQIRELVNELRDIAVEYYGTQQLRERIARTVRAAMFAPRGQAAPLLDSESKNTDSKPGGNEPVSQAYKLPERVINALTLSLQAMEFMGDTLNNLDAVCTEDVEFIAPAFEAVRAVLAGNFRENEDSSTNNFREIAETSTNSPVIPDGCWQAASPEELNKRIVREPNLLLIEDRGELVNCPRCGRDAHLLHRAGVKHYWCRACGLGECGK